MSGDASSDSTASINAQSIALLNESSEPKVKRKRDVGAPRRNSETERDAKAIEEIAAGSRDEKKPVDKTGTKDRSKKLVVKQLDDSSEAVGQGG